MSECFNGLAFSRKVELNYLQCMCQCMNVSHAIPLLLSVLLSGYINLPVYYKRFTACSVQESVHTYCSYCCFLDGDGLPSIFPSTCLVSLFWPPPTTCTNPFSWHCCPSATTRLAVTHLFLFFCSVPVNVTSPTSNWCGMTRLMAPVSAPTW